MRRSRLLVSRLCATVAAVGLVAGIVVATPAAPAGARPSGASDGGAASAGSDRLGATADLSAVAADRWIVQLEDAPVARRGAAARRLDVAAPENVSYRSDLRGKQSAFAERLRREAPGARVERAYQVALNGLAVTMSPEEAAAVRHLPGVRAVTPDIPFQLDMFATPQQIGAPTVWGKLGGQSRAGEGVKVAIIDSGIYTPNACFNDAGYRAPRGFPKGDTQFTNNKVIAARAYFRPDDPPSAGNDTPLPGPDSSPHGTHVAGTVACNAGTVAEIQGVEVALSGVAPRAYLMNYRVFYPATVDDDFQNGNAYVAVVQAIDDAVADGADVISNSWGSSYQNTLAWADPMVEASEAAVDAGVVMVYANGNSGPAHASMNSPALSPKVIAVGATTKNVTIVPGAIDVTGPEPVPPALIGMAVGPAQFGPQPTANVGPAPYVPAQVASGESSLGCNPFPAGSLTGSIALIERGVCEFSTKVLNAQQAGAIAALVYNSAANGDNLQAMGPGAVADQVTIPSWFMRRSQGLAMRDFTLANPTATAQFVYAPQTTSNIGDVMAGFSSRGPSQDKLIKPDVVAPGVDIISSGYATGDHPAPLAGFGSSSGTSMATPHVAGAAALLVQLHPSWTPAQVKSALMTTATEEVFLDTARTVPADILDRGSGRIDLTRAGDPGLTLDAPSLSAGELAAGQSLPMTITATNVSGSDSTWNVSASGDGLTVAPSPTTLHLRKTRSSAITVQVGTPGAAEPGDYFGEVVFANPATGQELHVPVWLGVRQPATTDVLLVDDDGSAFGFADYRAAYEAALTAAGVSFDTIDAAIDGFPTAIGLYAYRAVVMFTGDNDSFDTSGLFPGDQDAIAEWLDSGGRLWVSGQNMAETTDSNADFESPHQGRARLFHGYLGLRHEVAAVYAGAPPTPTALGGALMEGIALDLAPNGDGTDNQTSIQADSAFANNDTFQAANTMTPLFRPIGASMPAGSAVSFSRGSEPSLEEERVIFRYRSISMGFGLEGINGTEVRGDVADRTLDWLLDQISVTVSASLSGANRKTATLTADAASSNAEIVQYRWDFGDGSPIVTTTEPSVTHRHAPRRSYTARVEVTDSLGHRSIAHAVINV